MTNLKFGDILQNANGYSYKYIMNYSYKNVDLTILLNLNTNKYLVANRIESDEKGRIVWGYGYYGDTMGACVGYCEEKRLEAIEG